MTANHSNGWGRVRYDRMAWIKSPDAQRTAPYYKLPGMLVGRVLRSVHGHARIKAIDFTRAAALPGVRAIVTAAGFSELPSEFVPSRETREHTVAVLTPNAFNQCFDHSVQDHQTLLAIPHPRAWFGH